MSSAKNVLRRSLLTNTSPGEEKRRRAEISEVPNPVKRAAALALHGLAMRYPETAHGVAGLKRRTDGATYLAAGGDTVVYKTDHLTVQKVHKSSFEVPDRAKRVIVAEKIMLHGILKDCLPGYTLPQSTYLDEHPVYHDLPVALTEQPFRGDIQASRLFSGNSDEVRMPRLRALVSDDTMRSQLSIFVQAGQELIAQEGYTPDVVGVRNLVISSEQNALILLDGQPLPLTCIEGVRSQTRLGNLQASLEQIA